MRFLLDTVTLSSFRRPDRAPPSVVRWQESKRGQVGFVSVISLQEIRYGLRKVEGRDPVFAARLSEWYARLIALPDQFRLLGVDRPIAEQAADYRAAFNTPLPDALIAATVKVHGLTLATRNVADFEACGIDVVNPWEFEG